MLRHMRPTVARTLEQECERCRADDAHARVEFARLLACGQYREPSEAVVERVLRQARAPGTPAPAARRRRGSSTAPRSPAPCGPGRSRPGRSAGRCPVSPVISSSAPGTASTTAAAISATVTVVALGADVERPRPHHLRRRGQRGHDTPGDVVGVHQRAPRGAVGQHLDLVRQQRVAHQVVQHDVGAQPRGEPEGGGVAHRHRHEVGVGQRGEVVLDPHLGLRVRRDRPQRGVLVDQLVAATAPRRPSRSTRRRSARRRRPWPAGPAASTRGG